MTTRFQPHDLVISRKGKLGKVISAGGGLVLIQFESMGDTVLYPENTPELSLAQPPAPPAPVMCECGGDKARTTHSHWCPKACAGVHV